MAVPLLLSAGELAGRLGDPRLVVADCRFLLDDSAAGERAYLEAHASGAVYAHLDRDLSAPKTGSNGRHPLRAPDAMSEALGGLGISGGSHVVAYDDVGGGLAAARLWWMLRYLGHDDASLIDGGWQAWLAAGGPIRGGREALPPATFTGRARTEMALDAGEVERAASDAAWRVVDSRALSRYRGDEEPIDPVAGRIPGARHHFWQDNLTPGLRMRPRQELRGLFERVLDGAPPDHAVFYCGSGVTSAFQVFAMDVAGLPGSRLYPGSWSEWCSDRSRPVQRGA